MKTISAFLLYAFVALVPVAVLAQPATTAKTFRLYNDATHTVSFTAGAALGTGTFTWPQPADGFLRSNGSGVISLGAVDLSSSSDVTNVLGVTNGGTGSNSVGAAGSIAYSNGTSLSYSAAGTAGQLFISGGAGSPTWTSTLPAAITVPFNQISSGTNTTATMTVGNGATLAPSGTGIVTSNQFVGASSVTGAVDLATTEVNGTLGTANGGTGTTTVGAAGTIVYSNGTQYSFTAAGTAGQVLTSNGAGAPTWTSTIPAKAVGRVQGDGTNFSYTITPGGGYTATSTVVATLESSLNQAVTVTARTATTFTVQSPVVLTAADFINWVAY